MRSFFHFCKVVILEQIDESDRDDGLSFSKLQRKNEKSMCAASKRAVTASYLLCRNEGRQAACRAVNLTHQRFTTF